MESTGAMTATLRTINQLTLERLVEAGRYAESPFHLLPPTFSGCCARANGLTTTPTSGQVSSESYIKLSLAYNYLNSIIFANFYKSL